MVGVAGFEPTTPSPPVKCATRLRYTPTDLPHKWAGIVAIGPCGPNRKQGVMAVMVRFGGRRDDSVLTARAATVACGGASHKWLESALSRRRGAIDHPIVERAYRRSATAIVLARNFATCPTSDPRLRHRALGRRRQEYEQRQPH